MDDTPSNWQRPANQFLAPPIGGVVPGMTLTLTRLTDDTTPLHTATRAFCLTVIEEVYGFAYRPDWHADLDSLLRVGGDNQYAAVNRGAFWVAHTEDGALAATIGIKHLDWQPALLAALASRYPDPASVATLTRAYVRQDLRGQGMGRWLTALCEDMATSLGYRTVYLHTNADAAAATRFWTREGWREFGNFGFSTHFEKHLQTPGGPSGSPAISTE